MRGIIVRRTVLRGTKREERKQGEGDRGEERGLVPARLKYEEVQRTIYTDVTIK